MHKLVKHILIVIISLFALTSQGQCDNDFISSCSNSGGSIKYIKHFRIRFAEAKNVKKRSEGLFTVMLMKGNHYRFYVCNDATKPGTTIMELSNDFSQYGSNYNAQNNSEYKAFDFLCTKTGPYYIKMFFKEGKEGCGVCVLTLVTD